MPSSDPQQSISNQIAIIFGILATILTLLGVTVGCLQYRQNARNSIHQRDIEMQAPISPNSWHVPLIGNDDDFGVEATNLIEPPAPTYNGLGLRPPVQVGSHMSDALVGSVYAHLMARNARLIRPEVREGTAMLNVA
ncbi:hypothetical protein GLAREA_06016 [Glarea lozoyensis ATCC 20868]|uniref:Uncharacterized protein n=1 Tax=Glarea lozoyensis (strain ATCC 20868 / MF5171) TaxID=1116229 RepID=S3D781_GLAL2|nr:uncharacterized protein GLAREA_06016 [Glarea lozoyensis ATCC 20868]EPE33004.1 hypothetical protein GLAREA_06016 [Glarea lozoyensis ATCC 20868]